jgi:hypothetical protein
MPDGHATTNGSTVIRPDGYVWWATDGDEPVPTHVFM